jgi:NADH-quinone oxidoreductase subunit G
VKAGARVFRIGPPVDLTYKVTDLGNDLSLLGKLPGEVTDAFAGKENAALIIGMGALAGDGVYAAARAAAAGLGASFNLLHTAASRVGALDLGFAMAGGMSALIAQKAKVKALFLLGADEIDVEAFAEIFTIYIGSHGDRGVRHADVILPAAAYSEKHGIYVNLEGRVQYSEKAVDPPGEAREDWTIFRALSDVLGKTLPFDSLGQLRAAIAADHPHLGAPGLTSFGPPAALTLLADPSALLGRDPPRREFRGGGGMSFHPSIVIARSPSTPPAASLRINCRFAAATTQSSLARCIEPPLDCFAALAMTGEWMTVRGRRR